jgi:hypothetical protein
MQTGVSRSHRISQKKLKGMPKTIGYTRSHKATEKQVAAKGINPSRIDPSEGGFRGSSFKPIREIVAGFEHLDDGKTGSTESFPACRRHAKWPRNSSGD